MFRLTVGNASHCCACIGQEVSCSLFNIGNYYLNYVDLMSHSYDVLLGKILRVQYEDVVSNLEFEVRRLLDFCELPFEDGRLEFHKSSRVVRTASSEQVRQPIYQQGVDMWKKYEQYLAPLPKSLAAMVGAQP